MFENRVKRLRKDNMFSRFAEITIFAACDLTAFRSMRFSQQFSLLRLVPHRVRGIRVQIRKKSLDMISKQKMIRKWASCDINVMSHDCHKSVTWHHMTRVTQPVYILRTKIYFEQKFRKLFSNQKYNFDQKYNLTKKEANFDQNS